MMSTTIIIRNLVLLYALSAICLSSPSPKEFSWYKRVVPYQRGVQEKIQVIDDGRQKTILMFANDKNLEYTPFQPSTSFHDFMPKKPLSKGSLGMVALKSASGCFVTDVAKSFDDVLYEARRRMEKEVVTLDGPQQRYRVTEVIKDIPNYSDGLTRYCGDKRVYRIKPMPFDDLLPNDIYIDPHWLLCIWGPYPIYFPIDFIKNYEFNL